MAQQLVNDWSAVVHKAFSDAAATGEPLTQQLTTAFGGLAHHLESNTNLRAGMKLSLEPSIDGAHHTYMQWVDATGDVINCAVAAGDISNNGADRRLVWNLCAGFTGAVQVSTILRDDVNLTPPPASKTPSTRTSPQSRSAAQRRIKHQSGGTEKFSGISAPRRQTERATDRRRRPRESAANATYTPNRS
ncbi:hypothetical protein EEB13_30710 [Rhodococcus sp. WS3]|uniref:hypothetical protein n=1 Tax=Rhodococcus sp. WS3 TaxID=2486271 RepID=UPI00114420C5|nr:hypothetical protein [Rhodococcus sp. WS3]ROZ42809.1 hypothetical protein EEB13_30710 [Rhodococcus sp. WS3]